MTTPQKPETIDKLEAAVYPAFAMLADMKLDLFTPLKDGPQTALLSPTGRFLLIAQGSRAQRQLRNI